MKEIQRCADKNKVRLKVIERVDDSIRQKLQWSNPFKRTECGKDSCLVCERETSVDCRTRGCVYEMLCAECRRKYRGQTGHCIQKRTKQHFDGWRRGGETSPLHRHSQLFHEGKTFPVSIKVLKKCYGDQTGRRIAEAVLIDKLSSDETMNGRNEWTYIKLNKLSAYN